MKLKILFGLVLSVALLAMFGCGGDGGGTAGPTSNTIIASAGPGGTISPAGVSTVLPTFTVAYTITPDAANGYAISDVQIDGFSFGAINSFEFGTGGHTIHATFVKRPKTAIVKLVILGPLLPTGTLIGGVDTLLLYSQTLGLTPADVLKSGNGNIAGTTVTADTATAGQVGVVLTSATGIGAGEFATATFKLFSSAAGPVATGNVPSPGNFAISQLDSTVTGTGLGAAIIPGLYPFVGPVIIK